MKLLLAVILVTFMVLVFAPSDTDAVPPAWFLVIAAKLGVKLVKRSYYARCNTRYVPYQYDCPGIVFGVGLSRNQAIKAAKYYAATVGDSVCDKYVGHCQTHKFIK